MYTRAQSFPLLRKISFLNKFQKKKKKEEEEKKKKRLAECFSYFLMLKCGLKYFNFVLDIVVCLYGGVVLTISNPQRDQCKL